jgi:hypothetical protein
MVVPLTNYRLSPKKYTTVQISANAHVELSNPLVYMNHSCDPSVFVDTDKMAIYTLTSLKEGDEVTFFYPSTEWIMAEPFNCACRNKGVVAWESQLHASLY